MHNLVAIACLLLGGFLLLFGFGLYESVSSEVVSIFVGQPDDDAKWLLYGGTLFAALGAASLLLASGGPR